jgi:hypothetical protein
MTKLLEPEFIKIYKILKKRLFRFYLFTGESYSFLLEMSATLVYLFL